VNERRETLLIDQPMSALRQKRTSHTDNADYKGGTALRRSSFAACCHWR
jgi:hypothetical protein